MTKFVIIIGALLCAWVLYEYVCDSSLRVDTELKLSHDNFKQSLKHFYANKHLSAIDQLKATPPYPTPYVLAQFAHISRRDCKHGDHTTPEGWQLLTTASNSWINNGYFGINNGYFGTAYWRPEHQQVVIVNGGLETDNVFAYLLDLYTTIKGVYLNNFVDQMSSASTFANKVVAVLQEIEQEENVSFELFFTGHSLGGWLAQITAFTTKYLEERGGTFLKKQKREENEPLRRSTVQDSHHVTYSYHPHTLVFDSPGCKDMLSQMVDKFEVGLHRSLIDLQHLDITSYLSAPNIINTCNSHLGTVYRIFTESSDMGWLEKYTLFYNIATHSMDKIVHVFDPETGQVRKDTKGEPKIEEVVDWPVSAGLTGGAELNNFFKMAGYRNNYNPQVMDTVPNNLPQDEEKLRYKTKDYDERTLSLNVFTQDEREFLEQYNSLRHMSEFFMPTELLSIMNNSEAENEAERKLRNFKLVSGRIHCPDASTLHATIPYVKRLVRFFPLIKEKAKDQSSIKNRLYQQETQRHVENILQSVLDFNPGVLGLRKFLTSNQKVWQLRMVDGDAWTGITKLYRVLEKTSCTPNYSKKGHYTILELGKLLTDNRKLNFTPILESIQTPHLLVIECRDNQTVNDELNNMFKELFSILKQKNSMKIILTTQSECKTADFLEQIATEILGEGFITTNEKLNWCDLTASSQRKILEKTVIFQGTNISLNNLISAESMTDSFPLVDLLQEKELRIGEELVLSAGSGYNEKYYIDRTFSHNIAIRQDILADKFEGKFTDLLASSEQEFKELSQNNPTRNVHWLVKDDSGELIWQQSQGNLKTLREYVDAHKSHSYTPSDLGKLLQQAKDQKVMIIADAAGMGKTTVLTHLSKCIKQKYPAHWLVIIYLNDYTELLNAQEGKKMDKERVLEFVSKEVLKLESHLEKELFKNSLEGNVVHKVVVMVDGFDEISPRYKETVLDMLQVLKQTSLEQLWITTRQHLREELENNLQQLSYNLEPFSEFEQVKFLKKFWLRNVSIDDTNQSRLEVYAKTLIRKLAQSISDRYKEFTGIPLQTLMLAEAFEQDFISYNVSGKSEPELSHKLDLLGLYSLFIDRKYDIHYKEKPKMPTNNAARDKFKKTYLKHLQVSHQLLALEALFTEDQLTFLQSYDRDTFPDEEFSRIGIVQRNSEDKPQFIHPSFAEYFVAEFLINHLTKKTKQYTEVQDILLNEVLLKSDYHVMRAFLDGFLGKSMPSKEVLKDYGMKLDEQWKERKGNRTMTGFTTALFKAATGDNAHIIGFIVDSLKSAGCFNTLTEMMLAKDAKERNAWNLAGENRGLQALGKIWEWVEGVAPIPEI